MNNSAAQQSHAKRKQERNELVAQFVESNPDYYAKQFQILDSKAGLKWSFNWLAALLGLIWCGMRGFWCMPFAILETIAFIQIFRGLWGNLAATATARIESIQDTLAFRNQQLETAIENNAANVGVFKRAIKSLEAGITEIRQEIIQIEESAIYVALFGFVMLALLKLIEGIMANQVLERAFSDWLSDRTNSAGLSSLRTVLSGVFFIVVVAACVIHYAFPSKSAFLGESPPTPIYG